MTPCKFFAMLNCALEYKEASSGSGKENNKVVKNGYVDDIKW